jgi:hypothetical protein
MASAEANVVLDPFSCGADREETAEHRDHCGDGTIQAMGDAIALALASGERHGLSPYDRLNIVFEVRAFRCATVRQSALLDARLLEDVESYWRLEGFRFSLSFIAAPNRGLSYS